MAELAPIITTLLCRDLSEESEGKGMGCINWAWKFPVGRAGLKANEKLMLVAIADDADKETGTCHSRIPKLADDAAGGDRQARRLVRILEHGLELIHTTERNPGTGDGMRLIHCHLSIDPMEWVRPGRTRPIMSTSAFLEVLWKNFKDRPAPEVRIYQTWVEPLRILWVRQSRLFISVPSSAFAQTIIDRQFDQIILETAKQHISPKIEKIRFWYPKDRPKTIKN